MALNQITEKLDMLTKQELGFDFDEDKIWSQLSVRLEQKNRPAYWWLVAASLLLLTLLPVKILNETSQAYIGNTEEGVAVLGSTVETEHQDYVEQVIDGSDHIVPIITPQLRKHTNLQIAEIKIPDLIEKPMKFKEERKDLVVFNQKDISIIQASLESPTIENGRKVTIRAQWKNSPNDVPVNYQALKIKLYEKNE